MTEAPKLKPLLRGHFHQAAFFVSLGACMMLVSRVQGNIPRLAAVVYSLSLLAMFGISALYHRPQWNRRNYAIMRRLDHSAIFVSIAGTGTPVFLVALPFDVGFRLFVLIWLAASVGVLQSLFWSKSPKWFVALLAVMIGWLPVPYFPQISEAIGTFSEILLLLGGALYTIGALIYATKKPNPIPHIFGYHEIFHIFVILAAILHFIMVDRIFA